MISDSQIFGVSSDYVAIMIIIIMCNFIAVMNIIIVIIIIIVCHIALSYVIRIIKRQSSSLVTLKSYFMSWYLTNTYRLLHAVDLYSMFSIWKFPLSKILYTYICLSI